MTEAEQVEVMLSTGLKTDQIQNLYHLRAEFWSGNRSEVTTEYKRRTFAKYLIETNRLSENIPQDRPPTYHPY